MSASTSTIPGLHVLLIGVDYYLPGHLADGTYYPSLRGCVRDITHVETFLREQLRVPAEHVIKLTATNTGAADQQEPPEPREAWPTYENMVAAFKRLTEEASAGDWVYVHYSGHGGRAPTLAPERKGTDGEDEALVPTDIHAPGARYLRDLELALILKRLASTGVHLGVVFDSCHSGGVVRGSADVAIRGIGVLDTTPRPGESLVASAQELAASWGELTAGGQRNVSGGSSWLPEPEGYALLAACRPSESAYEFAFDGKERNGALTYWLLDTLRAHGTGLTYASLFERIAAQVHTQFVQQTPQLQGDGRLSFSGGAPGVLQPSVAVLDVRATDRLVKLATGQALGVGRDAQFAVYPLGTSDFLDKARRQAIVTLTDLGATDSWARVTEELSSGPIELGSPAVLINPGAKRLVRSVGFARPQDLPPGIDPSAAAAAFQAVRDALAGKPWLREQGGGEPVDFNVGIGGDRTYELWDANGSAIPNLRPPLRVGDAGAAKGVVARLAHLARYVAVEQLQNYDAQSPLAGKLLVELAGVQDDYVRGDPPEPRPFASPTGIPVLRAGQWTFLRIRNQSARSLNVAVLDLQPDWGVTQVYPQGEGFVELEPGKELLPPIALRAWLPEGYTDGTDTIKVMASLGPANFRFLELPALDQSALRAAGTRSSATPGGPNALEALMGAIAAERPRTRNVDVSVAPGAEWATASVELRVRKAPP